MTMLWGKPAAHRAQAAWVIIIVMSASLMPAPAQAGWWPPSWFKRSSGWGPPSGNSSSAAHRGGTCASTTSKLPLTALAPTPVQAVDEQALGATTAAYPTLWFYLPYTIGQSTPSTQAEKSDKTPQPFVELRLEEKNADDSAYHQRTILTMSYTQAGIIGIPLTSTSQSPLEVGKLYHWLFVIHCVPGDASANKFTRLSLLRVTPESRVPQPLEQSIPRPQRKLYTQYGLWDTVNDGVWNDFITALAALRCRSPNDATLTTLWAQSLTDVGLQSVAKQPLQCPPAVPR